MSKANRKNQLYFDFGRDYDARLSNFFFSQNNNVLKQEVENLTNDANKIDIYLEGGSASGKTFLLNSIINDAKFDSDKKIYIDLAKLDGSQNYFDELENFNLICLDNIEVIKKELQIQLFNLINVLKGSNASLILASSSHRKELDFFLDLKSRLNQMTFFSIKELISEETVECSKFISQNLNIDLPEEIHDLMAKKIKRDFQSIKKAIIDFDKFLYSEKRQPTKMSAASFLKNY